MYYGSLQRNLVLMGQVIYKEKGGEEKRGEQNKVAKQEQKKALMIDKRLQVDCRMSNSFVSVCIAFVCES